MKHNILYIITDSRMGGTERSLLTLLDNIDRTSFNVYISVIKGGGELIDEYKKRCDALLDVHCKSIFDIHYIFALKRFIVDNSITIVHSFLFHSNIVSRILKFIDINIKCVNSHRTIERSKTWHLFIDKLTKRYVDYEIANSLAVEIHCVQNTGSDPNRFSTIYNGYELPPRQTKTKKRPHLYFACIGSFSEAKAQLTLIKDLHPFILQTNYKIIFYGDGPLRKECESYVLKNSLDSRIQFGGKCLSIDDMYASIDGLIISSAWEGMPNVLFEALLRAKPVISTEVGGISELIKYSSGICFYEQGNSGSLQEKMSCVTQEYPDLVRILSKEAYTIADNFSIKRMIKDHEAIYKQLINSN